MSTRKEVLYSIYDEATVVLCNGSNNRNNVRELTRKLNRAYNTNDTMSVLIAASSFRMSGPRYNRLSRLIDMLHYEMQRKHGIKM